MLLLCLEKKHLSYFSAVFHLGCSVSTPPLFAWTTVRVTNWTSRSHTFMRHSRTNCRALEHAQKSTRPTLYNTKYPYLNQRSRLLVRLPGIAIRIGSRGILVVMARKRYMSSLLDRISNKKTNNFALWPELRVVQTKAVPSLRSYTSNKRIFSVGIQRPSPQRLGRRPQCPRGIRHQSNSR